MGIIIALFMVFIFVLIPLLIVKQRYILSRQMLAFELNMAQELLTMKQLIANPEVDASPKETHHE
jgi:hypothetical protein